MTEYSVGDLHPLLVKLWRNKWVIVFVTLAGFFAGMAVTANREPVISCRATSSVCVTYTTYQEQLRGSSAITSYSELVRSYLVCQRAAELIESTGLTPADIQKMVDNIVSSNSNVMYINATADEPLLAIMVANAVAQAFTEKISSVSGNNSLQVLDIAGSVQTITSSSNTIIVAAVAAPLLLSCAWIILKEIIKGKLRLISQCVEDPEELLCILPDAKQR